LYHNVGLLLSKREKSFKNRRIIMTKPKPTQTLNFGIHRCTTAAVLIIAFALAVAMTPPAQAQTFKVLYNFTGYSDGADPAAGLTMDGAGSLYGTTEFGANGSGTVFKLTHRNSAWVLSPLYAFPFQGEANPVARVIFGPDGSLYGTTQFGGSGPCNGSYGDNCGTVYNLKPPASACKAALCPWTETMLYSFNGPDGEFPTGDMVFDNAGNLYSTTSEGGSKGLGTVFRLTPSNGGWTQTVLYNFTGGADGLVPVAGPTFDRFGSLYGTTSYGPGTVYRLTPGGGGWTETTLYTFQGGSDGGYPSGGVIFDQANNLYGTTTTYGPSGSAGTAFELTPSSGAWAFTLLSGLPYSGYSDGGSYASLVMDNGGNLYGTTYVDGVHSCGSVFKLTPGGGGWTYTSLHDFTCGNDGGLPLGSLILDTKGNLYGTALVGGTGGNYCYPNSGCGVVFEITP
jgi:uncharacterized repeat protein (TIGR03803 family)